LIGFFVFLLCLIETISHLNICQLSESTHISLLPTLLHSNIQTRISSQTNEYNHYTALDNCICLITVDMSEPWNVIENVTKWLKCLENTIQSMFDTMKKEDVVKLKKKSKIKKKIDLRKIFFCFF
jgi:tRNA A58 N-methylase Trm61